MAKVIAPFKLSGTIGGITFSNTSEGNTAKEKREVFMTTEEFMNNPIYDPIREHGKEMGYSAKKSRVFRLLALNFYKNSKDVSFAGRANQILFEILEEDKVNPKGQRTLEEGMKSPFLNEIIPDFEGNKQKPLKKVLKTKYTHAPQERTIIITDFLANDHLEWPEEATHVHLAMAKANWNFTNDTFNTCYGEEVICSKESALQTLTLTTDNPAGNDYQFTFLFVGFAKKVRRKYTPLHRRNNTVSIIAFQKPGIDPN